MLGGFDPRSREVFFRRRRGRALACALLVYALSVALAYRLQSGAETEVEVELQPEIQDFAVDEEEPEIVEEPPPPPPPDTKVKVVQRPKPRPKLAPPEKKVTEAADESSRAKTVEVGPGAPRPGGTGTGEQPPESKPKTGPKPPPKPEPKLEPKATPKIDPTQPIDRPENATAPKALPNNPKPSYPEALKDEGITGSVLIKLHVHRDGTVRGAKVLRKTNNASTEEDKKRADALFLKAVIAVVQKWKYEPAKLGGQPITVWHKVNIPFSLTGGD
jgi:periplasmic protein TonB